MFEPGEVMFDGCCVVFRGPGVAKVLGDGGTEMVLLVAIEESELEGVQHVAWC